MAGYLNADVSTLAKCITCSNLKSHVKTIFFNLKETSDATVYQMLGAEALVESESIRIGKSIST